MLRKVLIVFFVVLASYSFAQPPLPSPSGHMVIRQGGNVVFNFSALKRYTTGMTLADWTIIEVFYDSDGGGTSWKLSINANSANIEGDMGNILNLDVIEITATSGIDPLNYNDLSPYCFPKITLTTLDQDLVGNQGLGGPPDIASLKRNIVNLTYECGVTNSLLGEAPDFYVVDLVVTLYED